MYIEPAGVSTEMVGVNYEKRGSQLAGMRKNEEEYTRARRGKCKPRREERKESGIYGRRRLEGSTIEAKGKSMDHSIKLFSDGEVNEKRDVDLGNLELMWHSV